MTVAKFMRGLALGALVLSLTLVTVNAQNGTGGANYHILNNGLDAFYLAVGAGTTVGGSFASTAADGIGVWIPGEELKGPSVAAFTADFAYKQTKFREMVCFLGPFAPPQTQHVIKFPLGMFIEIDHAGGPAFDLHGHKPAIFLHPQDPSCLGFPWGIPAGPSAGTFVPLGAMPAGTASASFVLSFLPTVVLGSNMPSGTVALLPNEGILLPSTSPDVTTALIMAWFNGVALNTNGSGGCWGVQFTWIPSSLTSVDDVNGWWHYLHNSADGNQYWGFSTDEQMMYQSNTVSTLTNLFTGGVAVQGFLAASDYDFNSATADPMTSMILAPISLAGAGSYTNQTENMGALNLNGGFDVGRGSRNLSLGGANGVDNGSGFGNQNVGQPGSNALLNTLGFMTWDNVGGAGTGSDRVTFVSFDWSYVAPFFAPPSLDPALSADFVKGGVRLPAPISPLAPGFPQGEMLALLPLFTHTAAAAPSGWPDPDGFSSGAFGVLPIAGASNQLPLAPLVPPVCVGIPLALTYGSTAVGGGPGSTAPMLWSNISTSGAREFFLVD